MNERTSSDSLKSSIFLGSWNGCNIESESEESM